MPPLLNLQKEHPNTLLDYHEQQRGANLGDLDLLRTIAYDLRDFEREIFVAFASMTGDGATTANFRISPGAFARPRSIRVLGIDITNENTNDKRYVVSVFRRVRAFLFNQRVGNVALSAPGRALVLGLNTSFATGVGNQLGDYQVPHVDVFANKPDGSPADQLDIASTSNITAGQVVSCTAIWETIPDPAKWSDGAPGLAVV